MTKPGVKTSEFWLQFVPVIMTVVTMLNPSLSRAIATVATALASGAYAYGRSTVKAGTPATNPEPKWLTTIQRDIADLAVQVGKVSDAANS